MDLAPQLLNSAVVVLMGLIVAYVVRDRARHQEKVFTARLEAHEAKTATQFAVVQAHLTAHDVRFDALQARIDQRFESMDRQFASMRSDLTQIALAVRAQPRPQAG
jgi:hypothetical protein